MITSPSWVLPLHRHHHNNRRLGQLFLSAVEGEEREREKGRGEGGDLFCSIERWMRECADDRWTEAELRRLGRRSDWLDDCRLIAISGRRSLGRSLTFLTNTTMPARATKWRRRTTRRIVAPCRPFLHHPQNLSFGIEENEFKPSIVAAFRNSVVLPPPL